MEELPNSFRIVFGLLGAVPELAQNNPGEADGLISVPVGEGLGPGLFSPETHQ
jgi:hypothetical protein